MIVAISSQVCMTYYDNKNILSSEIAISLALKISTHYLLLLISIIYFKSSK